MARSNGSSKLTSTRRFLLRYYQFWLIRHFWTDWFWLISFNGNCSFFFFITAFLVVNSTLILIINRINKVFHFSIRLLLWNIWSDDMIHFSFLFKFSFFNYPSLSNATQPDYGIINLNFFFKIFVVLFFLEENVTVNIFGRC